MPSRTSLSLFFSSQRGCSCNHDWVKLALHRDSMPLKVLQYVSLSPPEHEDGTSTIHILIFGAQYKMDTNIKTINTDIDWTDFP